MEKRRWSILLLIVLVACLGPASMAAGSEPPFAQAVTLTGLNVRFGPGVTHDKLGTIAQGTLVQIIEQDGEQQTVAEKTGFWYKVRASGDNLAGWVFGPFLSFGVLNVPDPRTSKPEAIDLQPIPAPDDPALADLYADSGVNKPNGFMYRLRTHDAQGGWIGPEVPSWIPKLIGRLELKILDIEGDGMLAFYRDPYGASSCSLDTSVNCRFVAAFYADDGERLWELELNRFMSADDYLEIQDIRWAPPYLYFNEGCMSYSESVEGRCSSLVAVDPARGQVAWRSPDLVSNDIFIIVEDWIIAGYGFTFEPDYLFVLDRFTGEIGDAEELDYAHQYLEVMGDLLYVPKYEGVSWFRIGTAH